MSQSEEMVQLLNHWIEELHRNKPDSIGDLVRFSVVSCDAEAGEYTFTVHTAAWMQNAFGTLHGGIIATVMDQGMGMLATCLTHGTGNTPSVQLNITYHRPFQPGDTIELKLHVDSMTRTLIHLHAEARKQGTPEKLCAAATAIFYFKPFAKE